MKAIVILLDTLNRRMLDVYNRQTSVKTPNISRLASKCAVFNNHWSGSLPCMPARRDIMTGRLSFLERGWGGMEPFDVKLPEVLRSSGIYTHLITDHYHYFETGGENYVQAFNSWDFQRGQESDPWISAIRPPARPPAYLGRLDDQYEKNRTAYKREEDYPGPRTMRSACRWLEENGDEDQFLLMVEAFDPHEPFDCPQHYLDAYDDDYDGPRYDWPIYARVGESPAAMAHLRRRYAATLTMIDHWLGKLLDVMDQKALWDDTLVILTTDHGILLGEHDWVGKNIMHVYNEIAHLPFMVHLPGGEAAGASISAITQNIDLMPTLLDYFGIDIPATVRGRSLLDLLSGRKSKIRDWALYGCFGATVNMTDGKYCYLRAPVREDNEPCYIYTAMPTAFRRFLGVQGVCGSMEVGSYLSYTDYPVYRIPYNRTRHLKVHHEQQSLLFNIESDYQQLEPVRDDGLVRRYTELLIRAMEAESAPEEQFIRLGLRASARQL